jgi:hypothetical protein
MKNKHSILKICAALLLVVASQTSCKKDFLDVNDNPNSPTESSITPNLVLPTALHRIAREQGVNYGVLSRWMGHWTRGGNFGPNGEEESYQLTTSFGDGIWQRWYDILADVNTMEKKANASGQKFYEGISKTLKVVSFHNLVDIFNNVPYTSAVDLGGNITPSYQKGDAIYKDLFLQLDAAQALIASAGDDVKITTADVMFAGNKTKWQKLINTLRLRLVLRLSQTGNTVVNLANELNKTTSAGFINETETAAVNPGYVKANNAANVSQQNPFWDSFLQNVSGNEVDDFNRANNYTLKSLRDSGFADIRYTRYYRTAKITDASQPLPYFGYDYGIPLSSINSDRSSKVSGPGLAKSETQAQWFLTATESLFMQAEARNRGLLTTGRSDADLFDAAVRESFTWLGLTVADANAYLASNKTCGGVALANFATSTNKLQTIMQQKYFSMVGVAALETYADYRRTGFPNVPKSLAPQVGSNIPVRYLYPQSEFSFNPTNVAAEGLINQFTSTIFWDR